MGRVTDTLDAFGAGWRAFREALADPEHARRRHAAADDATTEEAEAMMEAVSDLGAFEELVARVRALLRRGGSAAPAVLQLARGRLR